MNNKENSASQIQSVLPFGGAERGAAMRGSLDKDLQRLRDAADLRQRNLVGIQLNACLARVTDVSEQLESAIESTRGVRTLWRKLCELVSQVIEQAAEGNITATEYVQKQMAKQELWVFVGTHWMRCRIQQYYDFVKDACYKAGLSAEYVEDPQFMCQMFEFVAFRVARDRESYDPPKGVCINMMNGTLEIGSEQGSAILREHRKSDFYTYVLPYAYDPNAECPQWHAFLDQVIPETEMQMALAEYLGYCFTKKLKLEKMAVLYGAGANGKSVLTDVAMRMFGHENVSHVDLEKLTTDENHRMQFEGKLLNISQENGPNVNHAELKRLVTGEAVVVKTLYKDVRTTTNYGKIIASYNALPKVENTYGFFRRWIIFPFEVTIPEKERDPKLTQKLCEELPGILNWSLEGAVRVQANKGFTQSKKCDAALEDYRLNCNSAHRYFADRCTIAENGRMTLKELYADYLRYCSEENIRNTFGRNNFLQQVAALGAEKVKLHGNWYLNVMYKSES